MSNYLKSVNIHENLSSCFLLYCNFKTLLYKNQHFITGYSLKSFTSNFKKNKIISIQNEYILETESVKLIENLLDNCFLLDIPKIIVVFHNTSCFDSFFIINSCCKSEKYSLDVLSRDNIIYKVTVTNKKNKSIVFRDSYLLFPYTLSKMAETFGVSLKRNSFTHDLNILENYRKEEFLTNLLLDSEQDVNLLSETFEKFQCFIFKEFKLNILECLTLASFSLKLFRTSYYDCVLTPIQLLDGNRDSFIRESYRGGIVDVYKPLLICGYHYDINSLYPYVMKSFDMPIGEGTWLFNFSDFRLDDFFGFLEVEVTSPNNLYIPFLSFNHEQKGLISPTGTWIATYFSEELKYAVRLGYKLRFIKGISFRRGKIFEKFVSDLYNKRVSMAKDSSLNIVYKLIMNSVYGKLGMKNEINKCCFLDSKDEKAVKRIILTHNVKECINLGNKIMIKYDDIPSVEKLNELLFLKLINTKTYNSLTDKAFYGTRNLKNAVHLSSAITAYARIEMHTLKMKYQENLYYSDTDSLFLDIKLPDGLVSNTELGLLKYEGEINQGIFIAPKLYYIEYKDGRIITKGKGLSTSKLSFNHFISLLKGDSFYLKSNPRVYRNKNDYTVISKDLDIHLKGTLLKRQKVFTDGLWSGTKAFTI